MTNFNGNSPERDAAEEARPVMTAEQAKKLTGPDYHVETFTTTATTLPRPYTEPDSPSEASTMVETIAGRVDYQCPAAVARAVYESVESALELNDRDSVSEVAAPRWHFEVSHKRDFTTGADVGIYYTLFRDIAGTGFSSCGSWAYGDRTAAGRAINEIVEKLND
jgi:hypothetical protein